MKCRWSADKSRFQKLPSPSYRGGYRFLAFLVVGITLVAANSVHAQAPQDEVVYVDTDGIGSVRLITDTNGNVLERHDFQPFGQETPSASGSNPLFAGKERDASGADYSGARYFAAKLGRFLAVDPVAGKPGDPQSWNRYGYARNNPFLFVDPDGLESDLMLIVSGTAPADRCGALDLPGAERDLGTSEYLEIWNECRRDFSHDTLHTGGDEVNQHPTGDVGGGGGGGGTSGVVTVVSGIAADVSTLATTIVETIKNHLPKPAPKPWDYCGKNLSCFIAEIDKHPELQTRAEIPFGPGQFPTRITGFTDHGLLRLADPTRKLTQDLIADAVTKPVQGPLAIIEWSKASQMYEASYKYIGKHVTAVLNGAGEFITGWPSR